MKKIMSLVLALALVLSMGVTVFAAESTNPTTVKNEDIDNNNTNIEVIAEYTAGDKKYGGDKYYVTISWTEQNTLAYKDNTVTYNWDTSNMKYVPTTSNDGKFDGQDVITVKVENRSNKAITASYAVNEVDGYTLQTAFGDNSSSLEPGFLYGQVRQQGGHRGRGRGHQGVLSDPELGTDRVHQLQCRQDHLQLEPENAEL